MKILEHCCYTRYLNEWYATHGDTDSINLINFGDHTLTELLDWCINMCIGHDPITVTIAMPHISPDTRTWLTSHKYIHHLNLLTSSEANTPTLPIEGEMSQSDREGLNIQEAHVPGLHTQIATVSGGGRHFVLQGNLLQAVSPGKYITTLGLTQRYYDTIQPMLQSWIRTYSRKAHHT